MTVITYMRFSVEWVMQTVFRDMSHGSGNIKVIFLGWGNSDVLHQRAVSPKKIKRPVLWHTLTRVWSEWNWRAHPVTNGNNVLPSSHTLQQRDVSSSSEWTQVPAAAERWEAWQPSDNRVFVNDSIRQLSRVPRQAHCCVLHRLAVLSWWATKEFVIICIIPQRWSWPVMGAFFCLGCSADPVWQIYSSGLLVGAVN